MVGFLDEPIPEGHFFVNAPNCHTRREATEHYVRNTHFSRPQATDAHDELLHHIDHPFSNGMVIDRQIIARKDQTIIKSVRAGGSDLEAEQRYLEIIKTNTSIPVPTVHTFYRSVEFEHLVMDRMPGRTLESVWPELSVPARESIADQAIAYIDQLRKLQSPCIDAAAVQRVPLPTRIKTVNEFNDERFKSFLEHPPIATFIKTRCAAVEGQPYVFTHADLDWSNILVDGEKVSGMIDWECSGYFPAYWEWMIAKTRSKGLPQGSWFPLLEARLEKHKRVGWDGMWEVEQLAQALEKFSSWALTPEDREENRTKGWAEVIRILGTDDIAPPTVEYTMALKHPWWLETVPT